MGNFKEDIARTEAFVFDVDGVMTDGGIVPTVDGDFIRRYNAKDGYALAYALRMGYRVCVISGGRGRTLENRLKMLGIKEYHLDCMDKITTLRDYFRREGIDAANVIYMGDDIPTWSACARWGFRSARPMRPPKWSGRAAMSRSSRAARGPCATSSNRCCAPAATGPAIRRA